MPEVESDGNPHLALENPGDLVEQKPKEEMDEEWTDQVVEWWHGRHLPSGLSGESYSDARLARFTWRFSPAPPARHPTPGKLFLRGTAQAVPLSYLEGPLEALANSLYLFCYA